MDSDAVAVIEALRPTRDQKIMDLVAETGIDVSGWAFKGNGEPVKTPRANPSFCYEWAFGGDREPIALCIWHESLKTHEGWVVFKGHLRERALKLDSLATDRSKPDHVRSRARDQAARSRSFDLLVQRAYRKALPVRAVLIEGERRTEGELGWDSSTVKYRLLDTKQWYVHRYDDEDGSFLLVRNVAVQAVLTAASAMPELSRSVAFVDQFSLLESPARHEAMRSSYERSASVRNVVLQRAKGNCECCGTRGFITSAGAVFLETHHVVPLSKMGSDMEWNVVALCPNDHRKAHYAEDKVAVQQRLIEFLILSYPNAAEALRVGAKAGL